VSADAIEPEAPEFLLEAEIGPSADPACPSGALLDACGVAGDGTWRLVRASLRRA
jgi:hypothetical protein